jgi:hypothetical protein
MAVQVDKRHRGDVEDSTNFLQEIGFLGLIIECAEAGAGGACACKSSNAVQAMSAACKVKSVVAGARESSLVS